MNKHTATDRNGKTHTRNSAGRVYTHCVAVRPSYESHLKDANAAWALDKSNYGYYRAYLDGTSEFLVKPSYRSEEDHAADCANNIAKAQKALDGCDSLEAYREKNRKARVEAVEGQKARGYYDAFKCYGWNGSRALAEKLASTLRGGTWAEVVILEATVTQTKKKVAA
jgi:hypothetical protein